MGRLARAQGWEGAHRRSSVCVHRAYVWGSRGLEGAAATVREAIRGGGLWEGDGSSGAIECDAPSVEHWHSDRERMS